ncbi:hypothetical protein D3C71_1509550 [compost metagenome]
MVFFQIYKLKFYSGYRRLHDLFPESFSAVAGHKFIGVESARQYGNLNPQAYAFQHRDRLHRRRLSRTVPVIADDNLVRQRLHHGHMVLRERGSHSGNAVMHI